MGVVADMADDILVMKDGHTVEHGSADQIFNRPQHPYSKELLAAVPKTRLIGKANSQCRGAQADAGHEDGECNYRLSKAWSSS